MTRTKSLTTAQYSGNPTLPVLCFEADFRALLISMMLLPCVSACMPASTSKSCIYKSKLASFFAIGVTPFYLV